MLTSSGPRAALAASRPDSRPGLTLSNGRRVFVKAMNAQRWPLEAGTYRTEALVAAALPAQVPAPRFLKTLDDGHWTVLAFEDIDGTTPSQP